MFVDDFNDSSHVRSAGFRELLRATGEEDFKPGGGCNDPMAARHLAYVAVAMCHLARQVDDSGRSDFRPFAVHAITDSGVDDQEDFVFSVMHMQRRHAAWRRHAEQNRKLVAGLYSA